MGAEDYTPYIIVLAVLIAAIVGLGTAIFLHGRRRSSGHRVGPYDIEEVLSDAGGMARIFRARHRRTGRFVALKVLRSEYARDPEAVRLFSQEGAHLRRFHEDRTTPKADLPIVFCYEHGMGRTGSGVTVPFIALELLPGMDLGKILNDNLRSRARLRPGHAVKVARQMAQALTAAMIVHRDLAGDNVMVLNDVYDIKMIDFGVARTHASSTRSGASWGKPHYMSPEQIRNEDLDPRSDIYSIGVLLYFMLEGRPPFNSENFAEVLRMHEHEEPPPLSAEVPSSLSALLYSMLAKDRVDRPRSMVQLERSLAAIEAELAR